MIGILLEFGKNLFPTEGRGLDLHGQAENSSCKNRNISVDVSTSVFEETPGIASPTD